MVQKAPLQLDQQQIMSRPMVAGLIIKDHKLLLVHNTKHNSLRIEPPGGKVEENESLENAMLRELAEELKLNVRIKSLFGVYETNSPEGSFSVSMFICEIGSGTPELAEPNIISNFGWYDYSGLETLASEGKLVPNMVSALPKLKNLL